MSNIQRPQTLGAHFRRSHRLFGITLVICLTIMIAGIVVVTTIELPAASRAARAQRAASRSIEAALDQQSNFSAYLLSGDERFLTRYKANAEAFLAAHRDTTDALASNKRLTTLLIETRVRHEEWQAQADQIMARSHTPADIKSAVSQTDPLFDGYRREADVLADAVSTDRVLRARRFHVAAALPTVLVFLAFITGILLLSRERRLLETLVITPIAELETAARKVAEGDLDVEVQPTGVDDFRQLGEDINIMKLALAEERERAQLTIESAGEERTQLQDLLEFARAAGGHSSLGDLQTFLCEESRRMSGARGVVLIERLTDGELRVACNAGELNLDAHGGKLIERAVMIGRTTKAPDGIVVPLVHAGQVIAILQFIGDSSLMDDQLVELIVVQSGSALEVVRAHEEAEYLSEHDPLTGALNRRRFDADLELELNRAARYGSPMSLMMIDVDHFKKINDGHGHHFGDHVLRTIASSLSESVRTTDSTYRYGGEEFAVIARQTDLQSVIPIASRLRRDAQRRTEQITSVDVTLSIGLASAPEVGHSSEFIISRADAALYMAKERGRDRILAARLSEFMEV